MFCIFHFRAPLMAVAMVALLSIGCAPNRAPAVRYVQQAEQLHQSALASTIIPNEDLNAYVQEIGKRLEGAAKDAAPDKARGPFFQNLQFHLVDSPIVNCYMTGGSHVYVYRGLLDFCRSEEELASAIAHAYAHALNLDFELTKLNPPEKPKPLRDVAWDFVTNRFTAQQEADADKLAFQLYARAGWDPARFESLFGRLSDEFPGPPAADREPLGKRGEDVRGLVPSTSKKMAITPRRRPPHVRRAPQTSRQPSLHKPRVERRTVVSAGIPELHPVTRFGRAEASAGQTQTPAAAADTGGTKLTPA